MPTNSPMPSPDINAPSPTSSVSIEDLNVQNISYEAVSDVNKYMINSSLETINNDSDIYVPTTVATNIKSYVTTESYNTVQGMLHLTYIRYFLVIKFFFLKYLINIQNCMIQPL